MRKLVVFFLIIGFLKVQSQVVNRKTMVFKVRAPISSCTVTCKDKDFTIEKEALVEIKIKGRNQKINVTIIGGRIISSNKGIYRLRFLNAGTAGITVHQLTNSGSSVIGVKSFDVKAPRMFFCGIALDSTTNSLKLKGCQFYAYSNYFKTNLPIRRFSMLYVEDATKKEREWKADTLKSDTCRMTAAMKQKVLHFQPKSNKIYFYNIYVTIPDGTIRALEPIELLATMDFDYSVIYTIRKKKV
jgi:hypothetical protein